MPAGDRWACLFLTAEGLARERGCCPHPLHGERTGRCACVDVSVRTQLGMRDADDRPCVRVRLCVCVVVGRVLAALAHVCGMISHAALSSAALLLRVTRIVACVGLFSDAASAYSRCCWMTQRRTPLRSRRHTVSTRAKRLHSESPMGTSSMLRAMHRSHLLR